MLFLIGLCLNAIGTEARLEEIRIFGVLQRFAVAYLVTGIVYTSQCPRKKKEAKVRKFCNKFHNLSQIDNRMLTEVRKVKYVDHSIFSTNF